MKKKNLNSGGVKEMILTVQGGRKGRGNCYSHFVVIALSTQSILHHI